MQSIDRNPETPTKLRETPMSGMRYSYRILNGPKHICSIPGTWVSHFPSLSRLPFSNRSTLTRLPPARLLYFHHLSTLFQPLPNSTTFDLLPPFSPFQPRGHPYECLQQLHALRAGTFGFAAQMAHDLRVRIHGDVPSTGSLDPFRPYVGMRVLHSVHHPDQYPEKLTIAVG